MDENRGFNVNDFDTNNFETANNTLPEGAVYDVFSENTATSADNAKSENMNRDYLKSIYKEDMNFLSKDIRMTRTGYHNDLLKLEENYKKQTTSYKRRIIFHVALTVALIAISVYFFRQWNLFMDLFHEHGGREYWAAAGLFGSLGYGSVFIGLFQGVIFTYSHIKKIKELDVMRQKAVKSLELKKKEFMMLGQYDASR